MTARTDSPATTWLYRPDIDGLRAVAVVGVMLFHAFPGKLTGGFVGVDIFFVISGFLITGIILTNLASGRFTFQDFYARRIRRIFPALILVLAALLVFGWFTLLAGDYRMLGTHVATASVFVSNIQLWRETGYFDQKSWTKPLMHLWSLGVEEQFYLFWPAAVLLASRAKRLSQTIVALAAASLLFSVMWTPAHASFAFFWPLTRLWELLAGSFIAYAKVEAPASQRNVASVAGVVLIAIAMLVLSENTAFPGAWALPVLGTVALIVAGPGAIVNRWLALRVVVWIGLISYPLYLWHWPILTLVRIISGGMPSPASRALALVAAAVLAAATFVAVERPLRARRPSLQMTGALLLLLAVLGGWGFYVHTADGFPNRHPSIVEATIDFDAQFDRQRCHLEKYNNRPVDFDPACAGPASTTAPLVAIIGDSHVGELSESFRKRQERDGFRLAQFTVGNCPPGSPDPICQGFFDWVVDRLKTNPPQVVVMGGRWRSTDLPGVQSAIARLRALGVRQVMVIGPTPEWTGMPSRVLFEAATGGSIWLSDLAKASRVPKATSVGLVAEQFATDQSLRKEVGGTAPYVSPIEMLCNASRECMTLTPAGEQVWGDLHHLSPAGSDWFVNAILPRVRSFF